MAEEAGEVLRLIKIPIWNLAQWQTSFKRMAVCTAGYAIAIVVTAYHLQTQQVRFGISGSVKSPQLIEFDTVPNAGKIVETVRVLPPDIFIDDERGSAAYRRHLTQVLIQRGIAELTAGVNGKRQQDGLNLVTGKPVYTADWLHPGLSLNP